MPSSEDQNPMPPSAEPEEKSANPGYALGQLAAALKTSREDPDPATRQRASTKVANWGKVLKGMLAGVLRVGSRTPVAATPAWATLEVVQGGFATGELRAEGPLQDHEEIRLATLSASPAIAPRERLNLSYLTDEGMVALQQRLQNGRYRIEIPEEGALLVIAWLLVHDQVDTAREILDELGPYLDRLRFYPIPEARPLPDNALANLQTVRETIQNLDAIRPPRSFLAQREATQVWAPLCDRAVELFLETVEGAVPSVQTGPDGTPLRRADGSYFLQGGWPCQHYPESWTARATALLDDYRRLRAEHRLCGKPEQKGENFALLRGYLEVCVQDPKRLTGRDVGRIRMVLAKIIAKRDVPSSGRCRQLRRWQTDLAERPTNLDLARVVRDRLAKLPPDEGLVGAGAVEEALAPVTASEATAFHLNVGLPLADRFDAKVRRALAAPVEELVRQEIISSGEVLAMVVPQLTAQISAAGLADPTLRRLYGALYRAFRKRRSLLLLNLESQVKLTELPWVKAIDAQRQNNRDTRDRARQALEQVVVLNYTAFPHQIVPNKLLQEIRQLSDDADLGLPLVEEVAADIFMGAFTPKFVYAARTAAKLLQGTLYERYYGISFERVFQIDDFKPPRPGGRETSPAFYALCSELAGSGTGGSYVAKNGKIIEQEQILTTHNLAVLFHALGLQETLQPRLGDMARDCFTWICRRQQQPSSDWKARLQMVKNTAYAWRQMLFYLAMMPEMEALPFHSWAAEHLSSQRPDFQARFSPALEGLTRTLQGQSPEDPPVSRRLLGWTTEGHWLLS